MRETPTELELRPEQLPTVVEGKSKENLDYSPDADAPKRFRDMYRRFLLKASLSRSAFSLMYGYIEELNRILELLKQSSAISEMTKTIEVIDALGQSLTDIIKFINQKLDPIFDATPQPDPAIIKQSEELLKRKNLDELRFIRDDFKGITHDINNMLSALISGPYLISISKTNEKALMWIGRMQISLDRIKKILDETLDEKKLVSQGVSEVSQSLRDIQLNLSSRGFDMQIAVDPSLESTENTLGLPAGYFHRLCFDLLDNSQKYGAKGAQILVTQEGSQLKIMIKDNGPGFGGVNPEEASRRSKKRSSLNGNGLPLCFAFCKQAGGSLRLVDPNAQGAEWEILLPMHAPQKATPKEQE